MMRQWVGIVSAVVLMMVGATVPPASAEDAAQPERTSQPGDPFGGQTLPPGPIFIITPGSGATALPPTADPEDVQAQIEKDREAAEAGTAGPTPGVAGSGGPSTGPTQTVGPDGVQGPGESPAVSPASSAEDQTGSSAAVWWASGVVGVVLAGLVVVLLAARRRRDRSSAASLNEHAS